MDFNTAIKHDQTGFLTDQFNGNHEGFVWKVNDPEKKGRVRVKVPGINGGSNDDLTDWLEVAGMPFGGSKGNGDYGMWWPLQPGQRVKVSFDANDPTVMYATPCGTFMEGKGKNKQNIPKDCKGCAGGGISA